MKQKLTKILSVTTCILAGSTFAVNAQSSESTTEIGLYGFLSGVQGTSSFGNITADFDVPFSDIVSALDGGLMGFINYRNGDWSFFGDLFYVNLSMGDTILSAPAVSITLESSLQQTIMEGFVG